jgi:hypothetical protein
MVGHFEHLVVVLGNKYQDDGLAICVDNVVPVQPVPYGAGDDRIVDSSRSVQ